MIRLGVNVDHIATIREARRTVIPDPVEAALIAERAGCDGITAHLRQDERHIKRRDIELFREIIKTKLNIELSTTPGIVSFVKRVKPDWACLVPERIEEITTEGGLDIFKQEKELKKVIPELKGKGIKVTLFIEPEKNIIEKAKELGSDAIEINTKSYGLRPDSKREIKRIIESAKHAKSLGLEVHAGHDLNYRNLYRMTEIEEIKEVNIGHSIIARAIFVGLERAVKEMLEILR
ncbi:pyridoxine 5'-phosphate synthase [candidate division WOR-3 bacterium]|nr:pyridoxine 5'-phosphate synthase [candidate division WOR-3 bacterium]